MNKKTVVFTLWALSAVLLTSCGTIPRNSTSPAKATKTTSTDTPARVLETGVASWYGPNFHGLTTANGETYNMNDLTAAHKTLPFNTVVQVENLDNGRSVVVRINDRGPYVGDRIIDLSKKSAETVDMINSGTANVRILLIKEGDRPVTDQNTSSRETFTVQLASFETEREAQNQSSNINGTRVESVAVSGRTFYRVYYGTYQNIEDARKAQQLLSQQGYSGFVKQLEN